MKRIWPLPEIHFTHLGDYHDARKITVVTTFPAWDVVKDKGNFKVESVVPVRTAILTDWDNLVEQVRGEAVYAVGGGLAVDAAKYLALKKGVPLICIPTALSVDALVAWSSAIRVDGCVKYIETTIPEKLIVDFQLISSAPPSIRAAGICDVLSIATGSWDWKFAEEKGKNSSSMRYLPYAAEIAHGILQGVIDCAESAGKGEEAGLRQLLDCILLETQLINVIGHARPEEGSEHYFAYAIENVVGHGKSHAELICPGILIMATLQGQDINPLKKAIRSCNIPLQNLDNGSIHNTLQKLPQYVVKHELPYGIAHEISEKMISKMDLNKILA